MILYKALVDLLWCFSLIYVNTKTSSIFYKYTSNNVFVSDTNYWQGISFHMSKAAERMISLLKCQIYIYPMSINCTWYALILLHHYVHDLFQSNSFILYNDWIIQCIDTNMKGCILRMNFQWLTSYSSLRLYFRKYSIGWYKIIKRTFQMFDPFNLLIKYDFIHLSSLQ